VRQLLTAAYPFLGVESNPGSGVLGFSQNCPGWLSQSRGHALECREPEIPLALLNETVLCPVHFDVIRKCLLRPILGLSALTDHLANALLQGRTATPHIATLK
jgi:hypothetical protein